MIISLSLSLYLSISLSLSLSLPLYTYIYIYIYTYIYAHTNIYRSARSLSVHVATAFAAHGAADKGVARYDSHEMNDETRALRTQRKTSSNQ